MYLCSSLAFIYAHMYMYISMLNFLCRKMSVNSSSAKQRLRTCLRYSKRRDRSRARCWNLKRDSWASARCSRPMTSQYDRFSARLFVQYNMLFWRNRGAYAYQFAYIDVLYVCIDILYVYIDIQCQFTICLSTDLRSNCYCVVICGVQVRIHVFKYCSTDYDDVTVNFQVHLLFVSDRSLR